MAYDSPFNRHRKALEADWFARMNDGDRDTYVYRYLDAEGRLLYIGQTANPKSRHAAHKSRAPWFAEVADYILSDRLTRKAALATEFCYISGLLDLPKPIHNRHGANGHLGPGSVHWETFIGEEMDRLEAEQPGYRMNEMRLGLDAAFAPLLALT